MSLLQREPDDQVRVIDEEGRVTDDAAVPDLDDDAFVAMYRAMRLARHFDERAVSLQRQGRMGTFPPLAGQEAAQVGSAFAVGPDDWVLPSYREHAVAMVLGQPITRSLLLWMGDERGNRPVEGVNMFPVTIPIGTQIPHAVGVAWGAEYAGEDAAAVCYFGDGATSEGDFHEGLNFAGVFDLPAVFVCNNNQWAISVPRSRQTASGTLAQKAEAYGFDGVQVDGMDPLAVYAVTRAAIEKARSESGRPRPTLLEAVQYRFGAHTTADDPTVYRSADEVKAWRGRDPIPRYERFLRDRGLLDDDRVAAIEADVEAEVTDAIRAAEAETRPHPDDIFKYVYAEPPENLETQREWLREVRDRHGDDTILEG